MNLGHGRGLVPLPSFRYVDFWEGLAGQRVLVGECGSDPPDVGHFGALNYFLQIRMESVKHSHSTVVPTT